MKLTTFQIKKFRNIVDSGKVTLDCALTCLAGKNEAGKSGVLEALHLFNPIHKETPSTQEHYPRWLLTKDSRQTNISEQAFITCEFELEPEDLDRVEATLGANAIPDKHISVSRQYDGELVWDLTCDEAGVLSHLIENLPIKLRHNFEGTASIIEFRDRLRALKDSTLSNEELEMIAERLSTEDDEDETSVLMEDLDLISDQLHELGIENGGIENAPIKLLRGLLPKFFLFSQYSTLPGRINLSELAFKKESADEDPNVQTARALIDLTGIDSKLLRNDDYDLRRSALESVSIELSNQIFKYWKQNPQLEVGIDVDKVNVQHGDKTVTVPRFMEVRIRDNRTGYSNNFAQRSSGFQWFFSFLVAFSAFEDQTPIVLLDEPAMRLHGKAQEDFVDFLRKKVTQKTQVILTTHSPFMISAGGLNQARIIEDRGPPDGAVVLSIQETVSSDSSAPLRAAIAHEISESLFGDGPHLLVENLSDYLILIVLNHACASDGRVVLDKSIQITPVGAAKLISLFSNLVSAESSFAILDTGIDDAMHQLPQGISAELKNDGRLVSPAVARKGSIELEELFTDGDYLKLFNKTHKTKLKASNLGKIGVISERIERETGETYSKVAVARTLIQLHAEHSFSKTTIDRFETLIKHINQCYH